MTLYRCHTCGATFTAWTGKSGAQTHANEVHGGGRIEMNESALGGSTDER